MLVWCMFEDVKIPSSIHEFRFKVMMSTSLVQFETDLLGLFQGFVVVSE